MKLWASGNWSSDLEVEWPGGNCLRLLYTFFSSQIYISLIIVFWNHFSEIPRFYSHHCPTSLVGLKIIQLDPNRKVSFQGRKKPMLAMPGK